MRRDDADIARGELDQLHMPRRPAGECYSPGRQTAQAPGVVGRLVRGQKVGRLCKLVDAHTVLQHDYDPFLRQLDPAYRCERADFEGRLALEVVPEDELEVG